VDVILTDFNEIMQVHDAQEFLNQLINEIDEEMKAVICDLNNRPGGSNTITEEEKACLNDEAPHRPLPDKLSPIVDRNFGITVRTIKKCDTCSFRR